MTKKKELLEQTRSIQEWIEYAEEIEQTHTDGELVYEKMLVSVDFVKEELESLHELIADYFDNNFRGNNKVSKFTVILKQFIESIERNVELNEHLKEERKNES